MPVIAARSAPIDGMNSSVARRMSRLVATFAISNTVMAPSSRPSRPWSSGRMTSRIGRCSRGVSVRRLLIAYAIAPAANSPGITDRRIAPRMPTAATRAIASSGPMIAPALSSARSNP